ncbi:MAG TPA: glycosyltransferase family 4 protein [Rhizomicrobium sp.]|jgi:glycosyltransferase involved in cell wall biosynthesis
MTVNCGNNPDRPAILQIVPALDSGGAERSTIEIAEALSREGFAPLVASAGGRMVGELERAGGEWIAAPVNTRSPLGIVSNAGMLDALIRRRNIRLVHARSRAPAWSALIAARRAGVPFVTTHHGIYSGRTPWKRLYNSVMVRGDAVIANSQWTADHIRALYGDTPRRLRVIPRGIDPARFDPASVSAAQVLALRQSWRAGPDDVVILLPGRLTRLKGQLVLIAALGRLAAREDIGRLRLVLAGDAQGRTDYEQEIRRAISTAGLERMAEIVGHVEDMPTAYSASDIVISASTQPESFGRTVAEASAMGRAVIATDHGGARETVLQARSGYLVPPGDEDALAGAIRQLVQMGPEGRAAMGVSGRAHVLERFTTARMTGATIALYRDLLGK